MGGEEKQNKSARTTTNIRKYISCKRRKEKETTEEQTPTMAPPESSPVKGEQTGHYLDRAGHERDQEEQEKKGQRWPLTPPRRRPGTWPGTATR